MSKIIELNGMIKDFIGDNFNSSKYSPVVTVNNGRYHESWDALMPVVDKIDEMIQSNGKMKDYFEITDGIVLNGSDLFCLPNLQEVYADVVKFIQLFNKNAFKQ